MQSNTFAQPNPEIFALKDSPNGREPGGEEPHRKASPCSSTGDGGRALFCKVCRSKITRGELGMEVNGKHRHVFFNPEGLVFELGCFASAKNVIPTGIQTDEFTWFPGFTWQVIGCTGCASQLGWRYTGPMGGFFGFILNTLIEEDTGRA